MHQTAVKLEARTPKPVFKAPQDNPGGLESDAWGKYRRGSVLARWARDRKGASAILFALALPVVTGFAGLGVDTAVWYPEKREVQEVADSASLAGASEFATNTATQAVMETVATAAAAKSGSSGVAPAIDQPPASGLFAAADTYADSHGDGGLGGIT